MKKYIFTIVALISMYVVAQAVADVSATRMIQIGKVIIPSGTLIYALTFTLRDLLHKKLGKQWALATIVMAGLLNIMQSAYLLLVANISAPVFYALDEAWQEIFMIVPSITIASIMAEMLSQIIDTEVYQFIMDKRPKWAQMTRVLISNGIALPVDSIIFAVLGFVLLPMLFGGTAYSLQVAMSLTLGQIIYKGIVTIASSPLIYLIKDKPLSVIVR